MTMIARNWRASAALGLLVASGSWFGTEARAQIAYTPIVSSILNGSALTAQPIVSADRRYVRLTLTPYFNTVNGFTTYSAPIGAVGGGFGGGFGGFGGVAGGFGGGVAGPIVTTAGFRDTGTYMAGDYPPPAARQRMGTDRAIDPFGPQDAVPVKDGMASRSPATPATARAWDKVNPSVLAGTGDQPSVRPSRNSAPDQTARKPLKRPTTAKRRR
jgi:hypothetical protein